MFRVFSIFMLILAVFYSFSPAAAQEIGKTGNPLPRFVSISANEGNMRTGPGRQYPITWAYQRRNLPLKVIDENGPWRHVMDFEGTTGWMHRLLLSNKRTAIVASGPQILRNEPNIGSKVNATLQEGVIANLLECGPSWCKLNHPQVTGWLPRASLYGVLDGEMFD